ncbi:MAG TPA: hypothetical protein PLV05_02710 [Verrucomicrobiota bacterium]|jgi:hypothetical protein|nr:hypothetical protein [Verrucomicrobiota bacterium]OQC24776.1 MAG: hypothetical protein BWX68_01943 [Verrucomicrobia bacterium ADurb.Bin063]HRR63454.1 hypothetical protein [Candidatus Paceibacterota bacterium]MBP8016021.1 hypothetical protein [Verrucomicrobiota bacterium]MDI9372348.1 hypothetical protein [Verrucomicrobiota bacterium]
MSLDAAQRTKVAEWIEQGLKLSEIQSRLASEMGVRLTYMEARLLVDDLKLTPKDAEPSEVVESALVDATRGAPPEAAQARGNPQSAAPESALTGGSSGNVAVSVDQVARPGAMVSGKVTFSDGNTAAWQFDELGRLALAPSQAGYRPSPADVEKFQMALDAELNKLGL